MVRSSSAYRHNDEGGHAIFLPASPVPSILPHVVPFISARSLNVGDRWQTIGADRKTARGFAQV
jgi:hypothetical protein